MLTFCIITWFAKIYSLAYITCQNKHFKCVLYVSKSFRFYVCLFDLHWLDARCCLTCTSSSTERPVGIFPPNKMQAHKSPQTTWERVQTLFIHSDVFLYIVSLSQHAQRCVQATLQQLCGYVQYRNHKRGPLPSTGRCWNIWRSQPRLSSAGELQPAA